MNTSNFDFPQLLFSLYNFYYDHLSDPLRPRFTTDSLKSIQDFFSELHEQNLADTQLNLEYLLKVYTLINVINPLLIQIIKERSPFQIGDYVISSSSVSPKIQGYISRLEITTLYSPDSSFALTYNISAPTKTGAFSKNAKIIQYYVSPTHLIKTNPPQPMSP